MATTELANRCEAATGSDRKLDAEIFRAIGAPVPFQFANKMLALTFDEARQAYFAPIGDMCVRYEPPAYTGSLDAAITLVPEGCGWKAGWGQICSDEPMGGAQISRNAYYQGYSADYDVFSEAEAVTPALALCAAALRAVADLSIPPTPAA